jgi:hypothetical protein
MTTIELRMLWLAGMVTLALVALAVAFAIERVRGRSGTGSRTAEEHGPLRAPRVEPSAHNVLGQRASRVRAARAIADASMP